MAVNLDQIRTSFEKVTIGKGAWSPMWEVKWGDTSLSIVVGAFVNPDQKFALMAAVGDMADALGADTVVFISDVWHKDVVPGEDMGLRPSQDPNAQEAVMIAELSQAGQTFTMLPYGRGDAGEIEWLEPIPEMEKGDHAYESPLTDATREKLQGGKLDPVRAKEAVTRVLALEATVSLRSGLLEDLDGEIA